MSSLTVRAAVAVMLFRVAGGVVAATTTTTFQVDATVTVNF